MPKSNPQKHIVYSPLSSAESALRKSEAQRIHDEIKTYAQEMGGTEADIDPDTPSLKLGWIFQRELGRAWLNLIFRLRHTLELL
jgi:hypothetical protein